LRDKAESERRRKAAVWGGEKTKERSSRNHSRRRNCWFSTRSTQSQPDWHWWVGRLFGGCLPLLTRRGRYLTMHAAKTRVLVNVWRHERHRLLQAAVGLPLFIIIIAARATAAGSREEDVGSQTPCHSMDAQPAVLEIGFTPCHTQVVSSSVSFPTGFLGCPTVSSARDNELSPQPPGDSSL
jgi:hypothetical protein